MIILKGSNHLFNEIDIVIVSHAHNDHTSDLESILTLLYKYNKEIKDSSDPSKTNTIRNEIAQKKNIKAKDVTTAEIETAFYKSKRGKTINFYITKSVFIKYSGLFDLFEESDYTIHIIEPGYMIKFGNGIKGKVLDAKHYDIISDRDSIGLNIYTKEWSIIYTGDTGWNKDIERQYKSLFKNNENKYRLLIAHIGGFKEHERLYVTSKKNEYEYFYKNHLGRLGLSKINEILKPNLCFISEFGEELKGYRIQIADIYQKAFNNEIIFLPADIGLTFNINEQKIQAISKCNIGNNKLFYSYVNPKDVIVNILQKDFSLYYCHNVRSLNPTEVVQVLGEQFDKSKK